MAPNGKGYWLVAQDGGIFTFGSAHFYGSMGATHLNQPVFSMSPTKSGKGYWLVARDGGIFTFGDAKFYGSAGSLRLNQPITGITTSPSGKGYRMVATDGGIFSFGDVPFYGSLPGLGINVNDVIGNAPIPANTGYWIARSTGTGVLVRQRASAWAATPRRRATRSRRSSPTPPRRATASSPNPARRSRSAPHRVATTRRAIRGSARTRRRCRSPSTTRIQVGYSYEQVVSLVGGPGLADLADHLARQRHPDLQVDRRGPLRRERERHVPQRPHDLEGAVRAPVDTDLLKAR